MTGTRDQTAMSKPRKPKVPRPVDSRRDSLQPAQLFRVVAETATDGIITMDERSSILFANKASERIFGYPVSEMMGREVTMLMPDYLRETHRKSLGRYVQTGKKHISWTAIELRGLHRTGKEIHLEVSLGEQARGKTRIFAWIVRAVSQRGQSEAMLRQSEENYASIVHSTPGATTLRRLAHRRCL